MVDPLNKLGDEILAINASNGWDVSTPACWSNHNKLGTKLALVHSEVSEALEALRKDDRSNFAEELADALIRILDLSAGLDIDMDFEVRKKMEKNKTRGYRHGGKTV